MSEISGGEQICPHCFSPLKKESTQQSKTDKKTPEAGTASATRKSVSKATKAIESEPISMEALNARIQAVRSLKRRVAMGIDPGARYTGISIRDDRGEVYLSSTYYRDDEDSGTQWALKCVDYVAALVAVLEVDVMAVEGVVDPRGFHGGKKSPLNPRDIIRTALVVGAISQAYRDSIIEVRPRKNGSIVDEGHYPDAIKGRRPKDLPGFRDPRAKVRDHERSAYDVAGAALFATR